MLAHAGRQDAYSFKLTYITSLLFARITPAALF